MNRSSRIYDLMPPNLKDSEHELDSDSESDVKKGVNIKHQPDPAPRATESDSTMMIRNEDIDTENHNQVSSNDPRTICFTPGGGQSDDIHPFGRTSSDDMWERSTGKKANSGPCTNRMETRLGCFYITAILS